MPTVMFPASPARDASTGEPLLTIWGQAGRVVQRGTEIDMTLVDANGLPMSQPIYVTDGGFLPTFGVVEGLTQVDFVSGDVRMPVWSPAGLEASAAQSAAAAAASADAAEDIIDRANGGEFVGPMGPVGPEGAAGPAGPEAVPTMDAVTSYITTDTVVRKALDAGYARRGAASHAHLGGAEMLAAQRDFRSGSLTLAVASDSTGNDVNDWILVWLRLHAATLPTTMRVSSITWDPATLAYATPRVIQAGVEAPGSGGTVLDDAFTRARAQISGSAADNGPTWAGASSTWSTDGTVATCASGSIGYNVVDKSSAIRVDMTLVTAQTVASSWRVFVGANTVGGPAASGLWASVAISATGIVSISGWKTVSNVSTVIIPSMDAATIGLTNNTATPQNLTLDLAISGATLTLTTTVGSKITTRTATLSTAEEAGLNAYSGLLGFGTRGALAARRVQMMTNVVPAVIESIFVLNGAVAGTTLDYQQQRLTALYSADHIDAMIISGGHNYDLQTPAQFITAVRAFIDAYKALHPESRIIISSQNPQTTPRTTAQITAHAARQRALRLLAKELEADYVPAYETFTAQPDGGLSWVSDGVHPTTPPANTVTTGFGATSWAQAWQDIIRSRWMR